MVQHITYHWFSMLYIPLSYDVAGCRWYTIIGKRRIRNAFAVRGFFIHFTNKWVWGFFSGVFILPWSKSYSPPPENSSPFFYIFLLFFGNFYSFFPLFDFWRWLFPPPHVASFRENIYPWIYGLTINIMTRSSRC